jgi:hypothetical protein
LKGIVTRRDLLKIHGRLDAVIRDEVLQRILRRTLMIEPGAVRVTVNDGEVTLAGNTGRTTTALAAVGLTEGVAGVTGVVDRLTFDIDDTAAEPAPRRPVHDPMHGVGNGSDRSLAGSSLWAHANQVAGSEGSR